MAHIRERIGKNGKSTWQASVRRRGMVSTSKSFRYKSDAERWAASVDNNTDMLKEHAKYAIPSGCGCYVVFQADECIYVGSSTNNVLKRVSSWTGLASHYIIVPCEPLELLATEYRLIADYRPTKNVLGCTPLIRGRNPLPPPPTETTEAKPPRS